MQDNFSSITAKQIKKAITTFNTSSFLMIDRRGLTQDTKNYIRMFITPLQGVLGSSLTIYDIPDSVLKLFFDEMVAEVGLNTVLLRKSKVWFSMNVYPMDNKSHTESDMQFIEAFFIRLDHIGYINFQSAGSIWRIAMVG